MSLTTTGKALDTLVTGTSQPTTHLNSCNPNTPVCPNSPSDMDRAACTKEHHRVLEAARCFFDSLPGRANLCILVFNDEGYELESFAPHGENEFARADLLRTGSVSHTVKQALVSGQAGRNTASRVNMPELGSGYSGGLIRLQCDGEPEAVPAMVTDEPSHTFVHCMPRRSAHMPSRNCAWPTGLHTVRQIRLQCPGSLIIDRQLSDFEKATSLSSLSAGIAHEICNPLTTARGFLQLFEQRCAPGDRAYLALTIHELDRIQSLLEEFMDTSRPTKEVAQTVDLRTVVDSVYHFLGPEAALCNVELTVHVPATPVCVTVQPGKIKQVLINLLKNAVHACTNHGQVQLSLMDLQHDVVIIIEDNGCGIPDTHQLFRPFQTTKEHGNGLGMFVSKHIIEKHLGQVTVDSTPDVGTKITISLPRGGATIS